MKLYNKEGKIVNADKDQMEILIDAGWTKTKPEVVSEKTETKPVKVLKKPIKIITKE